MQTLRCVPLALSLMASGASTAQAQEAEIYELITTAIHVRSSETALPVTILSGDELHAAARATLGETLAGQPGINNASFGPAVGQTVIRGQQGRRVMNLSNGIPNADASGNSADHAQTVEAILANSIEVLRGPATLLYGGGAIGGVVNVIDRRIVGTLPSTPSLTLEARHDSAADIATVVGSLDFATNNLVWHFDALHREWNNLDIPGFAIDTRYLVEEHEVDPDQETSHQEEVENTWGQIANTGGDTTAATAGLSWIFNSGHLGFAITDLDNQYGLPPGTHSHAHDQDEEHGSDQQEGGEHVAEVPGTDFVFIDMQRSRYDLSGQWQDLAPWAETIDYRLSHTDYEHAEVEGSGEIGTRFSNASWQQRLQLTHADTPERHGVLGLQYSTEEFAAIGEESFIPVTDISATGLFMVEDFHTGTATIELGGRIGLDGYTPINSEAPDRHFSSWNLSGAVLWDLSAQTTLGLSLSRSQRAPSVEELYSNFGLSDPSDCVIHFATGACELGNTSLGAETSLNTDLTINLDYGRVSSTVTVFYNRFDDYIAQVNTGLEVDKFPVREYLQVDARFSGIEVDAKVQLTDLLTLRLFGDSINGSFDSYGDAPRMPPNRYGMEMNLQGSDWSAYLTLIHGGQQEKPGKFELGTERWTKVDVGADYRLDIGTSGELLLFIKGHNLGNEEIRLSTSYLRGFAPEPGRSVETGVRYRF